MNSHTDTSLNITPEEIALLDNDHDHLSVVETFIYEPDEDESSLGWLFVVGQVYSMQKKKKNAELLITLSERIKNEYYRNTQRQPLAALKAALKKTNKSLHKELRSSPALKPTIIVAAVVNETLLTAQLGDGAVFVVRNGTKTVLTQEAYYGQGVTYKHSFSSVLQGQLESGDSIVLATPQIYKAGSKHLVRRIEGRKFFSFVSKKKDEFKNLGCIVVHCTQKNSAAQSPAKNQSVAPSEGKDKEVAGPKKFKNTISAFLKNGMRPTFFGIGIAVLLAVTLSAVVLTTRSTQQEYQAQEILEETQTLEARITSLIGLENTQEAEKALLRWKGALSTLEQMGALEDAVRESRTAYEQARAQLYEYEDIAGRQLVTLPSSLAATGLHLLQGELIAFGQRSLYTFSLENEQGGLSELPARTADTAIDTIRDITTVDGTTYLITNSSILRRTDSSLGALLRDDRLAQAERIIFFGNALYLFTKTGVLSLPFNTEEAALRTWLTSSSIDDMRDAAVDGFVWVLDGDTLRKFLKGNEVLTRDLSAGTTKLFTHFDASAVYTLNPEEGIVSTYDSFGSLLRRVAHPALRGAQSITVSPDEETLYVLQDGTVFALDIRT